MDGSNFRIKVLLWMILKVKDSFSQTHPLPHRRSLTWRKARYPAFIEEMGVLDCKGTILFWPIFSHPKR